MSAVRMLVNLAEKKAAKWTETEEIENQQQMLEEVIPFFSFLFLFFS